jgi:hypothetical protein
MKTGRGGGEELVSLSDWLLLLLLHRLLPGSAAPQLPWRALLTMTGGRSSELSMVCEPQSIIVFF